MAYKLVYTRSAFKDIQKLDRVARRRLKKKIEEYSKKPITPARKLTSPAIGTYRWRIGNWRVIFDTDGENVVILKVKHRREIYR